MNPLKALILSAIHRHGPQSDMSLWHHSKCQTLTATLIAIAELADAGFIEKFRANAVLEHFPRPSYWQLTEKGRQHVTPRRRRTGGPLQQPLTDVQDAMKPAAALALQRDIDWHKVLLAWKRALISEGLDQNKGIVYRVSMKLRVGNAVVKRLVDADPALKAKARPSKKGPQKKAEQK
jgi:hypothetical protein